MKNTMTPLTPHQCKAARVFLDWNQGELANASGVTQKTVADFERGARMPRRETMKAIREALEKAGIEFIDSDGGGEGVRFSSSNVSI